MVEQTYELLRVTLPFRRWNLPHADELAFKIIPWKDREAHFLSGRNFTYHEIAVSTHWIKTLDRLAQAIAHEMVHMRMEQLKLPGGPNGHSHHFRRLAKSVCKHHEWDLENF